MVKLTKLAPFNNGAGEGEDDPGLRALCSCFSWEVC